VSWEGMRLRGEVWVVWRGRRKGTKRGAEREGILDMGGSGMYDGEGGNGGAVREGGAGGQEAGRIGELRGG